MKECNNPIRKQFNSKISLTIAYFLLGVVGAIFLIPIIFMVLTALKDLPQIYSGRFLPHPLHLENFTTMLTKYVPFPLQMKNSFIIATLAMIGEVLSAAFVGYGFARFKFPFRDIWFVILIGTMMMPFFVRMIPLFIIFRKLGWVDTFLPLIVPSFLGTPLFIFLMRQVFMSYPFELSEAAKIDGASELTIWSKIFLPLAKPGMAAVAILAFQQHWNEFVSPLIFLHSKEKMTAVLGLYSLLTPQEVIEWNVVMAMTIILVLPIAILFTVFQRAFVEGVTVSGMKG